MRRHSMIEKSNQPGERGETRRAGHTILHTREIRILHEAMGINGMGGLGGLVDTDVDFGLCNYQVHAKR